MSTEATKITYVEGSAPSTPAGSRVVLYAKSDGLLYSKDDAGAETLVSGGAGGSSMATDALWDAAGDLAVGTGANTAARLAKGSAGSFVAMSNGAVTWAGGTSFPGSPATNDLYYRTDDAELYYYDGTRWLSVAQYHLAFSISNAAMMTGLSATAEAGYATIPYKGTDGIWIEEFLATTYVSTTNNGTSYWTLDFSEYDDGAPASSVLATGNTSAHTAGQYNQIAATEDAVIPTDSVCLFINAVKTSSPGNLFIAGAEVVFRRVGS